MKFNTLLLSITLAFPGLATADNALSNSQAFESHLGSLPTQGLTQGFNSSANHDDSSPPSSPSNINRSTQNDFNEAAQDLPPNMS